MAIATPDERSSILSETMHIYTRVSTVAQADEGMSLDIQRDIGITRAEQLGFLHKVWNEGGRSSNHEEIDKRPILSQVLNGIRVGNIKHLFVYDQSRLSRNDYVSSVFRYECNKHGVTLYNKEGKYDLSNPQDQFLKQILDAVAQLDNSQRTERTRLGKLSHIRQGNWMGGPAPFGYRILDKKLEINTDEAKWVEKIFQSYADKISTLDIKVMLDINGVKPRRGGDGWAMGSLQAMFGNTHYIGHWTFNDKASGEVVRVDCPRILSTQLWQRVQETKGFHLERRHATAAVKHFYLLRGLLRCGHCGTLLGGVLSASQTKNHYYCTKKERVWSKRVITEEDKWKRGRVCSMTRSLNITETDSLIWNTVIDVISKSVMLKQEVKTEVLGEGGANTKLSEAEVEAIRRKIRQLKKTDEKLKAALARLETDRILERLSPDQFPLVRDNVNKERIAIEVEIETLEEKLQAVSQRKRWLDWLTKFKKKVEGYKDLTEEKKRDFLMALVTSIDVHMVDVRTHRLVINFQLPIVDDQVVYHDLGKKKEGYTVKEGSHQLETLLKSRPYRQKKTDA